MRIAGLFLIALVATSCGAFLTPPTGKGTPYPCGYFGTSCRPFDGSATCCPEHYACVQLDPGCEYSGNPDVPPDELMSTRKSGPPKTVQRMSETP